MRMVLRLNSDLVFELEGTPQECAQFAHALRHGPACRAQPPAKDQPTRRQQVLEAMAALRGEGNATPRIGDIVGMATRLFPDANPKNLDQVVRDLANRTDTVERLRWGCFALKDTEEDAS